MPMQFEATALSSTFAGAIAQNAGLDFDILLPAGIQTPAGSARCLLKGLAIVSAENIEWELWLWSSATHKVGTNTDAWLARWSFVTTDAVQETGDANWRYLIPDLDFPYRDDDQAGKIHLTLIPRTAGGHGAGQFVLIKLYLQPEIGYV